VIPGFEARLVDDQGRPVAPGMIGQLLIKGDSTSPGYWNRHERTKATMQGDWLRTGDMFYQDTDGYFFFCGRTDDMLKVGGMWVAPAEVEAAVSDHPAVLEVAVVGRGDADGLTKPHAYCVLRDGIAGSDALAAELREGVRKRLGGYKSPRWIDFVPELPKTTTGKIQRFALRQR
jgi:acyl-coenzyme A synthetase/AMP-(fatty) acid ligase